MSRAGDSSGGTSRAARGAVAYRGGRPPFGWRAVAGELVPDPAARRAVEVVRRGTLSGASLRRICAELAELGVPAPAGRKWHPMAVARIAARETR